MELTINLQIYDSAEGPSAGNCIVKAYHNRVTKKASMATSTKENLHLQQYVCVCVCEKVSERERSTSEGAKINLTSMAGLSTSNSSELPRTLVIFVVINIQKENICTRTTY